MGYQMEIEEGLHEPMEIDQDVEKYFEENDIV